jgi:hypothetical protein
MANPMGNATRMAMNEVSNVPDSKGRIPYLFFVNNGVHSVSVKNSTMDTSLKNLNASMARTRMIPTVVRMVIEALIRRNFSTIYSDFLTIYSLFKENRQK